MASGRCGQRASKKSANVNHLIAHSNKRKCVLILDYLSTSCLLSKKKIMFVSHKVLVAVHDHKESTLKTTKVES